MSDDNSDKLDKFEEVAIETLMELARDKQDAYRYDAARELLAHWRLRNPVFPPTQSVHPGLPQPPAGQITGSRFLQTSQTSHTPQFPDVVENILSLTLAETKLLLDCVEYTFEEAKHCDDFLDTAVKPLSNMLQRLKAVPLNSESQILRPEGEN